MIVVNDTSSKTNENFDLYVSNQRIVYFSGSDCFCQIT